MPTINSYRGSDRQARHGSAASSSRNTGYSALHNVDDSPMANVDDTVGLEDNVSEASRMEDVEAVVDLNKKEKLDAVEEPVPKVVAEQGQEDEGERSSTSLTTGAPIGRADSGSKPHEGISPTVAVAEAANVGADPRVGLPALDVKEPISIEPSLSVSSRAGEVDALDETEDMKASVGGKDGEFCIRVLDLNANSFQIVCKPTWKVLAFKNSVAEKSNVDAGLQRLIYRGQVMVNDRTLEDYKVENGHTVHLFARKGPPIGGDDSQCQMGTIAVEDPTAGDAALAAALAWGSFSPANRRFASSTRGESRNSTVDTPLLQSARRVKLWSSMLLVIYTMNLLSSIAIFAGFETVYRDRNGNTHTKEHSPSVFDFIALIINCFGIYVGISGLRAAHNMNLHEVIKFCRGLVSMAVLTIGQCVYQVVARLNDDEGESYRSYSRKDLILAMILNIIIVVLLWAICIHHALLLRRNVQRQTHSLPVAVTLVQAQPL